MAKYDVTYVCGHNGIIYLIGKHKDRQWRLEREAEKLCSECWKKQREEERQREDAAATTENRAAGLPPLEGTEKQVPWAEAIRKSLLSRIESHIREITRNERTARIATRLYNFDPAKVDVALESIRSRKAASWWIDNRGGDAHSALTSDTINLINREYDNIQKERQAPPGAVIEVANAEATVRPKEPKTETVAEISVSSDDTVKISFPEKREDFWQIVKKELGYTWSGRAWERKLTPQNGTPADRAAEAGHTLLAAGFIVRIFDTGIREAAITGAYEPEQTRWIFARVAGAKKYTGWFVIEWKRPDDLYAAAKKLPGSRYDSPFVVVPPEQFEQVLDFAETYGFSLSPGAQRAAETARTAKEAMLVVSVEPSKLKPDPIKVGTKPPVLEVPEEVKVDETLRDKD